MIRSVVAALVAGSLTLLPALPAAAATQMGYDISWPQCSVADGGFANPLPPSTTQFVVVGLTFGLPFTENPCLAEQIGYVRGLGKPAHAYGMVAFPTAAQLTRYGPTGPFGGGTRAGQLRNVGHAEARVALASLRAVGWRPDRVWVDVEPRPKQPWPGGSAARELENRLVIEGYLQGLADAGFRSGVYSYLNGWNEITGGWRLPTVPVWATAGRRGSAAAAAMCAGPSFSGGPVLLAQWYDDLRDYNVTCGSFAFPPPTPTLSYPSVSPAFSLTSRPGATVTAGPSLSQYWTLGVTDACTGAGIRSYSGRTADLIRVTWDGRTVAGTAAPPGVYRLRLRTGTTSAVTGPSFLYDTEVATYGRYGLGGCAVTRMMGPDRYATAVHIGRASAPRSSRAVLVSGEEGHLVDGIVSAPYARALGAPLLLTTGTALPVVVVSELTRRGVTDVVVVGSADVVSTAVVGELAALGIRVTRVAGRDRYETAAAVGRRLAALSGPAPEVVVTAGADASLVDALAVSGPAAALGLPVLLTAASRVPTATAAALAEVGAAGADLTVVGSSAVVSDSVVAALAAGGRSVRRLGGADRWATAATVASAYESRVGVGRVVLANGVGYVDALPGGALGLLTVLTAKSALPAATEAWLRARPAAVVDVLGSPAVVAPGVAAFVGRR